MAGLGQPLEGSVLHSDLDSVYTSYDWLRRVLLDDGLRVSYSERGAKDNPWIESLWGRMKTEEGSRIVEAQTLSDLEDVIDERFHYEDAINAPSGRTGSFTTTVGVATPRSATSRL
jgi:hypothetical protein